MSNQTSAPKITPVFSQAQLALLERLFPQRIMGANCSVQELRMYFGEQRVLQEVRTRTQ